MAVIFTKARANYKGTIKVMQITAHLRSIIELIVAKPTVLLVAPTGSGKSIGVPAAIAAIGSKVLVSAPTRTAAISLAAYQSTIQAKSKSGVTVGYAADAEIHYDESTNIVYATSGHVRKKMLSYFDDGQVAPITFCDVLFVDEIHSGSLDNTVIVSLWMTAASAGVTVPRLLLASATPIPLEIQPAPSVYTVKLNNYPVDIIYDTTDYKHDKVLAVAARKAAMIHNENLPSAKNKGHILVFAAGSSEVQRIAQDIREELTRTKTISSAKIIPVFGALRQEDIATIYDETPVNIRKIIIATNIAETAITIDELGYVVDSLYEKRAETSKNGGLRLTTRMISKDSAKQRLGRTGRTMPGKCYRLCTEATFNTLEDHRPAEIDRVPIYEVVMDIMGVGLDPAIILPQSSQTKITSSIALLNKLGMINDDNVVTDIGLFAAYFPISVRNTRFIWDWDERKLPLFVGIVLACLMDNFGPSYFWVPRKEPGENPEDYRLKIAAHMDKYMSKYTGPSDLDTCINLWLDLTKNIGGYDHHSRALGRYCQDNSLNNKQIKELLKSVKQSVLGARRYGLKFKEGNFTREGAMKQVLDSLHKAYPDRVMYNQRGESYYSPDTRESYRLDRNMIGTYNANPPTALIAINTTEIMSGGRSNRVISFAVATDKYDPDIAAKSADRSKTRPRTTQSANPISIRATTTIDINDDLLDSLLGIIPSDTKTTDGTDNFDILDSLVPNTTSSSEPKDDKVDEVVKDQVVKDQVVDEVVVDQVVDASDLNPRFKISKIKTGAKTLNLVNDHDLYIGTYQRGLNYFVAVKDAGYENALGYFDANDSNQVAFAWCCASAQLQCHIYTNAESALTDTVGGYGAAVYIIDDASKQEQLDAFVESNAATMVFADGLFDESYMEYLAAGINNVANYEDIKAAVMWVMDDSGVLVTALSKIWPKTLYNVVTSNQNIKSRLVDIKHKLYISKLPMGVATTDLPPYDSDATNDAKVWSSVKINAKTGDWIWNAR